MGGGRRLGLGSCFRQAEAGQDLGLAADFPLALDLRGAAGAE